MVLCTIVVAFNIHEYNVFVYILNILQNSDTFYLTHILQNSDTFYRIVGVLVLSSNKVGFEGTSFQRKLI